MTRSADSDGSVFEEPDSSIHSEEDASEKEPSEEEEEEEGEEARLPPDCPTPVTSLSSKASPRFPSNLKTIPCSFPDCDKMFNRLAKLNQHLRSHTNTRPFVCPHPPCTKDFLRDSHLKHHIKSAHSNVREYVCPREGCGKSFVTGTRLRKHNAVHEGQDKFRCQVTGCGQSFRKHGTLQRHVTVVHEGKKPYICQLLDEKGVSCGAGFQSAGMLKSHEGRVHGSTRFYCVVCSPEGPENVERKGFSTYAALQAHTASEHPPTCLECGLRCASNRELKVHVEVQHGSLGVDERRTHACPENGCGRAFTSKGNLTTHIQKVHAGKRFVCGSVDLNDLHKIEGWDGSDACGRAYTSKLSLEEHIRTAHLGLDRARKESKGADSSQPPRTSRKKATSSLLWLTGSGYENEKESGRGIACLLSYCDYRFMREIDLQSHLELHHGMACSMIPEILRAGERLVSRPALNGSSVWATAQDLEAEVALDMQSGHDDEMEDVQQTLHDEPSEPKHHHDWDRMSHNGESWLTGETEGERMSGGEPVHGDREGHENEMIDPSLY